MRNLSICCALLVLAVVSMQTSAQSLKIGYVNVTRIESESAMAQQSIEKLKKEFAPREQQLQVMQKQGLEGETLIRELRRALQPAMAGKS